MSIEAGRSRLTVADLASRFLTDMIPVTGTFSYFSTLPLGEDELKQYLNDPIAALSPVVCRLLRKVGVALGPYLERGNGREPDAISFEKPLENRALPFSRMPAADILILAFGIRDVELADYHFNFYNALAATIAERWDEDLREPFCRLLREELSAEMHGEVDERSWHVKQALLRRQANVRRETKLFRDYARQAFEDTLTLYLHGTCCDIDVDTGPRQMPSRYLRKRLELFYALFPPPEGYAVFPEQVRGRRKPQ